MSTDLDTSITEIGWSARVSNCLSLNCDPPVKTLRDLVAFSDFELLRVPNLGRRSINEIKGTLAEHGLALSSRGHSLAIVEILAKDAAEADLIKAGLARPEVMAFVKIMGALSPLTQRAAKRVLAFVADKLDEEVH